MGLNANIIANSAKAISAAATYLSNPVLIFKTSIGANIGGLKLDLNVPSMFCFLEAEVRRKIGTADVTTTPVIISGGVKQYANDSVSPQPWVWELEGYIPGISQIETTVNFTPLLRYNIASLESAYREGMVCGFKDTDNKYYNDVVIERLEISDSADVKNKQPFSMTLREIYIIEGGLLGAAKKAAAKIKSIL